MGYQVGFSCTGDKQNSLEEKTVFKPVTNISKKLDNLGIWLISSIAERLTEIKDYVFNLYIVKQ